MSSWCQEILSSIKDDSIWKASITFPSSIWSNADSYDEPILSQINVSTATSSTVSNTSNIDIIQLFNQRIQIQKRFYKRQLG